MASPAVSQARRSPYASSAIKISWAGTACAAWQTRHHNGSWNDPRRRNLLSSVLMEASTSSFVTGHRYLAIKQLHVSNGNGLGEIRQFWTRAGAWMVCGYFSFQAKKSKSSACGHRLRLPRALSDARLAFERSQTADASRGPIRARRRLTQRRKGCAQPGYEGHCLSMSPEAVPAPQRCAVERRW